MPKTTHISETREYKIRHDMIQRCTNPKDTGYHRYGGRGITVCDRWLASFQNFLDDMGECPSDKHTIDRIDNDGPYSPDNCRWATRIEQMNNTRTNHMLTYGDETMSIADWSRRTGIKQVVIHRRVRDGLPMDLVLLQGRISPKTGLPCKNATPLKGIA